MRRSETARPERLLLVGNSVRYLAQSAQRAGLPVTAVDAFGDIDTRLASCRVQRSVGMDAAALAEAVGRLGLAHGIDWSYAAGFEPVPAVLRDVLRRHRNLLGNDPRVLQLLSDPPRWFRLLGDLGIALPQFRLLPPQAGGGWLRKRAASYGGLGVSSPDPMMTATDDAYYQQRIDGPVVSLLFAADGKRAQAIGYSRLFVVSPAQHDFRYAGAISHCPISVSQRAVMDTAARRLTRALGLRGINGLDFVIDRGNPLLLDLNARPPATLELYEHELAHGGLLGHLDACRGQLPGQTRSGSVRGMLIVYATHEVRMQQVDWPGWVTDRPAPGESIDAGAPICTVHATGGHEDVVQRALRQRADAVEALLLGQREEAA